MLCIHSPDGKRFWIAPGGGLEESESPEVGLRRELREELGLDAFEIGPVVWRREHTFDRGERRACQREHYHVVHVLRFEPLMSDAVEAEWLEGFRWWTLRELRTAAEDLVPVSPAEIIENYLANGGPATLPEWEVLVDQLRLANPHR
jgi:8-oxo-dGTP pyrophosphatase MutT (NUDIX family)